MQSQLADHPQIDGLVEHFNQTLKSMIHKVSKKDGKDWDRLLPYLLFVCREVLQASTGLSPFELLYGRDVRGPLNMLKESWEVGSNENESVVSYVLLMMESLNITELLQGKALEYQKHYCQLQAVCTRG